MKLTLKQLKEKLFQLVEKNLGEGKSILFQNTNRRGNFCNPTGIPKGASIVKLAE